MVKKIEKIYISPSKFYMDSLRLGKKIIEAGVRPDLLIALWRGGTQPGIIISEMLFKVGVRHEHMPLKASSYKGVARQDKLEIYGLTEFRRLLRAKKIKKVLIIDDIFDTGITMRGLVRKIKGVNKKLKIFTAAVYFNPKNNKTDMEPDFFVKKLYKWVIFPHELNMSKAEIKKHKPCTYRIIKDMLKN
ncbi:MAG: hypothetical protein B6U68_01175 [Candidatus Aenigmarchaeota archaeon ex4484_14]|nr:MAG: hypothetical protein B6U68_01175 [Candidatus Aenigmarchaeota archaeon ex4484_14]